jgi:hypothetical protein
MAPDASCVATIGVSEGLMPETLMQKMPLPDRLTLGLP